MTLKKSLLACGAILLLSGLVLLSRSQIVEEKEKFQTINYKEDSWEVSANFTEGDRLVVDFRPATWEYREPPDDIRPHPYKFVRIEIVSPKNENTTFDITLMWPSGATLPQVANITVFNQDGLIVTNPMGIVGGVVMYNGTYTARIPENGLWLPETDPPIWIALRKQMVEKEYTFDFLRPVGVAFLVIGGVVTLLGGIISRRRTSVRIRHKPKPK